MTQTHTLPPFDTNTLHREKMCYTVLITVLRNVLAKVTYGCLVVFAVLIFLKLPFFAQVNAFAPALLLFGAASYLAWLIFLRRRVFNHFTRRVFALVCAVPKPVYYAAIVVFVLSWSVLQTYKLTFTTNNGEDANSIFAHGFKFYLNDPANYNDQFYEYIRYYPFQIPSVMLSELFFNLAHGHIGVYFVLSSLFIGTVNAVAIILVLEICLKLFNTRGFLAALPPVVLILLVNANFASPLYPSFQIFIFPITALFCYLKYLNAGSRRRKWIYLTSAGLVLGVGTICKPTVAFTLAAIVIMTVLTGRTSPLVKIQSKYLQCINCVIMVAILSLCTFLPGVLFSAAISNTKYTNFKSYSEFTENSAGVIHYMVLGTGESGQCCNMGDYYDTELGHDEQLGREYALDWYFGRGVESLEFDANKIQTFLAFADHQIPLDTANTQREELFALFPQFTPFKQVIQSIAQPLTLFKQGAYFVMWILLAAGVVLYRKLGGLKKYLSLLISGNIVILTFATMITEQAPRYFILLDPLFVIAVGIAADYIVNGRSGAHPSDTY